MDRTKQEHEPHPRLVDCRNRLESDLAITRQHAAAVCNRLTDEQVEAVLAAKSTDEVQKAVENPGQKPEEPKKAEQKPKATSRK